MIFIILVLGFPLRYCSIGTECLRGFLFRININNKNNCILILKLKIYLYLCFIINTKTNIMKTFKILNYVLCIGTKGLCIVNNKRKVVTFTLKFKL